MFIFDVETLGVESNAVVLSAALIHFDPEKRPTYQDLIDNACFVKFKAKEQAHNSRTITKSTLEWWKAQHEYVKKVSLDPSPEDVSARQGIETLYTYMAKFPNADKQTMWARGSLDQLVIDSLAVKVGAVEITDYAQWRDVRTAVDIMFGSTNGYCEVDHQIGRAHV
mgnify:CR=1 FL=1